MIKYVGVNIDNLKDELHYDLPDHNLIHGSPFANVHPESIRENIVCRHSAELVLKQAIADYKLAEPIRIWPHHFDTGTLIPLDWDSTGEITQSVGLGWAIPDGMVDEPYYYLSVWTRDPMEFPAQMPLMNSGSWMMPQ